MEARHKSKEYFQKSLEEQAECNNVICLDTTNVVCREIALNFILENQSFMLVQNDTFCEGSTIHYVLTFAKSEYASLF